MLPALLDSLQFVYCSNRCTKNAFIGLYPTYYSFPSVKKNKYVRMLFVNYSSVFNPLVPSKLDVKLQALALNSSQRSWILDFLSGRCQMVRIGSNISTLLTLSTGTSQGCVFSLPLYFFAHLQLCGQKLLQFTIKQKSL